MGRCGQCIHLNTQLRKSNILTVDSFYCELQKRYVKKDGSCDGFEQRPTYSGGGGCFLTSACVEYLGKADDCEELTALRSFRDNYMKSTKEGNALVKQYYEIAPKIVEQINASDKKETYYNYIYEVIEKCVKLIELKEYERTLNEYKFMVENLKKEFSL